MHMIRFSFAFCFLLLVWTGMSQAKAPAYPNILFILTDNQAAAQIGAYGNTEIRTPNIDGLARNGVLFSNAFAANGMCSPTRATLFTGLMPSQHGVHNWLDDSKLEEWPDDWSVVAEFRTLPYTLAKLGYHTGLIGKWHLGQPWSPTLKFKHWVTMAHGHTLDFWHNEVVENGVHDVVDDQHIVDYFSDKAVDFIDAYDGAQPFYLQLNYDGPYSNPPTNTGPAKNRFYKDYEGKPFSSFPREALNPNLIEQLVEFASGGRKDAFVSRMIQAIANMHNDPATMANVASQNTLVDDGIGRVLAALDRNGLAENTLVIFSSDQGNMVGQHGLWTHTTITSPSHLYEAAMRIPLIFRHKGHIPAGERREELVGQYDLATTILNYIGVHNVTFQNSPGRDFSGVITGNSKSKLETGAVFYEQEEARGIHKGSWTYWAYLGDRWSPRLFNTADDPAQKIDLHGHPEYAEIEAELAAELKAFFKKYSDPHYDLWKGGTAKGSVVRPELFRQIYGDQWTTEARSIPQYSD